jgi:hypothetical protein
MRRGEEVLVLSDELLGRIRGTALATLSLRPSRNPEVNHYQRGVVPQAPDTTVQQSHQSVNIVASVERISSQNLCNDPINNVFARKEEKHKISELAELPTWRNKTVSLSYAYRGLYSNLSILLYVIKCSVIAFL